MPLPFPLLTFEQWLSLNGEHLSVKAYEQPDPVFDFEHFLTVEYEKYCNQCSMPSVT